MAVYQYPANSKKRSKDGRSWYFRVPYTNLSGKRIQHYSKNYHTKKEALQAEREFLLTECERTDNKNMKFKDLYEAFYEYQKEKVKETTFQTYKDRVPFLKMLDDIKLVDFNIMHFEKWKKEMNKRDIANSYKNDILKFLKAILNFGTKYYDFNFSSVYNKMTNFTNPSEVKKEMDFYTFDEFHKFISYETDLKYICLFETLFYCGLRNGEMRAVTWNDIDFNNKILHIRKQIPTRYSSKNWKFTSTKTKNSKRQIPICDVLFEHLTELYNEQSKYSNFKKDWFVFGTGNIPIVADNPNERQQSICKKANLKKIRIHDFRHSCASFLISKGSSIVLVAKYLGHTKIEETLNTYSHLYNGELEEIKNKINDENAKKTLSTDTNNNTISDLPTIV